MIVTNFKQLEVETNYEPYTYYEVMKGGKYWRSGEVVYTSNSPGVDIQFFNLSQYKSWQRLSELITQGVVLRKLEPGESFTVTI